MKAAIISLLLALAGACDRDAGRSDLDLDLGAARVTAAVEIDHRSQLDLARALDDIERGDPYEAADRYHAVVRSYEGRRYRWTVQLVESLCRPERCNVLAFERGGRGLVGQSWMPRLELAPGQHRALIDRCAGRSPCPIEIEGRMADLRASTEKFTAVTFDRIELTETSARR